MKYLGLLILTACASLGPQFKPVESRNSKQALVYFYRPAEFAGSVHDFRIIIDGKQVGLLPNGAYFSVELSPGPHQVIQKSAFDGFPPIPFQVKANETYYVLTDVSAPNLDFPYPQNKKDERCPYMGQPPIFKNRDAKEYLDHMDRRAQEKTCRTGFMFVTEEFALKTISETKLSSQK